MTPSLIRLCPMSPHLHARSCWALSGPFAALVRMCKSLCDKYKIVCVCVKSRHVYFSAPSPSRPHNVSWACFHSTWKCPIHFNDRIRVHKIHVPKFTSIFPMVVPSSCFQCLLLLRQHVAEKGIIHMSLRTGACFSVG